MEPLSFHDNKMSLSRIIAVTCALLVLWGCAPSGSAPEGDGRVDFTEACQSCGEVHQYSYSFNQVDYEFLQTAFADEQLFYWKAPHGPTPACSSRYASDLRYKFLKESMPSLKRETFKSFLRKNARIAVHKNEGSPVPVSKKEGKQISRPGLDHLHQQALVYDGMSMILFRRTASGWEVAESLMLWI